MAKHKMWYTNRLKQQDAEGKKHVYALVRNIEKLKNEAGLDDSVLMDLSLETGFSQAYVLKSVQDIAGIMNFCGVKSVEGLVGKVITAVMGERENVVALTVNTNLV